MTQEDKNLLLKDLCAKLPYGVFVKWKTARNPAIVKSISDEKLVIYRKESIGIFAWECCIEDIKPYLRPMSSMTKEEIAEYVIVWDSRKPYIPTEAMDWLNEHHFDYRNLIGKGLAIEAHKDMYEV